MVFQQIDKIKEEYTDKYVVVDGNRPELARFKELVGQVKTVNMSGRALVEFMDYHLNIGWYDIGLDYLKVVDKPPPKEAKPAAKKAAPKPAAKKQAAASGEKKLSPLEMARMQGAGGKSTATEKPAPAPAAKIEPPAEKLSAASSPTKVDRAKMSVADMLASARGGAEAKSEAESAAEPEPVAAPTEPAASGDVVKVDKSKMSIDEMLAHCREHDAG